MFRVKDNDKRFIKYPLNPIHTRGEGDKFAHPFLFLRLSQKKIPATYDETLCKFLFCTYEDTCNSIWSKKLSMGHVEDNYVAWVENCNFKICDFRWIIDEIRVVFIKLSLIHLKISSNHLKFCIRCFFGIFQTLTF